MSNLFTKAAVCTDIHFGKSNNSIQHNEDCLNYIKWFIEQAELNDCDAAIFCGDWHHNRSTTNSVTLQYTLRALELLNMAFPNVYFIVGNHDLYYRDRRDISSVAFAQYLPNIHLIHDTTTMGDVTFCSWLVQNEHVQLRKMGGKYCFGHFELGGFKLNNSLIMPDHDGHIKISDLGGYEEVYSGHYHKRQSKMNEAGTTITYFGNCFAHDFGDVNEEESRGMMLLEWGEIPQYLAWPDAPSFRYYTLSDVLNNTAELLKPHMSCRVTTDIAISFEEANFIKEELMPKYNLREMQLMPQKNSEATETDGAQLTFHSVDQIVAEALESIESNSIDKQLLMEIYRSL
jgi:DNA repair exonuclease SbcCD nuclease subunit